MDNSGKQPMVLELRLTRDLKKRDFRRKARALAALGRDGKLVKTKPPPRGNPVKKYRKDTVKRIKERYKDNPALMKKMLKKFDSGTSGADPRGVTKRDQYMEPDHIHELQLGGADKADNLMWLDSRTNRLLGGDIKVALNGVPEGTPIIVRIVE
ncbi:HNH endonuclease signature motif containing protein [Glycomyces sp. YM15]|uniref:HNH endonuclease signature motif containing protein n=1 Tax=Glycomyces sp. YM15 TaxID=2800446 RepID=UPI0019660354|nr:HNH endonuclease signature motif containing protein [Glycomyces sp. YM15]